MLNADELPPSSEKRSSIDGSKGAAVAVRAVGVKEGEGARDTRSGRSKAQERTRSRPRTGQPAMGARWGMLSDGVSGDEGKRRRDVPILVKTRALCSTKLNSVFSGTSLDPLAVCSERVLIWENSSASEGSSSCGSAMEVIPKSRS